VVVEPDGARTMFSDRRAAGSLAGFDGRVIDDVDVLHVPFFGLADTESDAGFGPLLTRARANRVVVSLDPSSVTLAGRAFADLVCETGPDVVFCNEAEAAALGVDSDGLPGARLVVVKRGPDPVLLRGEVVAEVPARRVLCAADTTGAGDAFAGGFLLALARGADPITAADAGHAAAARVVQGIGADAWTAEAGVP
jgi:sugar/nucleoside kinase (ribokinase family)